MNYQEFMESNTPLHPQTVTQKEMCSILGVCISTGRAISRRERFGVKYVNTPHGREQEIKTRDILSYLYRRERLNEMDDEAKLVLTNYYEKRLKSYSEFLLVTDIITITGYCKSAVNHWIENGKLISLSYMGNAVRSPNFAKGRGNIILKESAIDFLSSAYYRGIRRKSELHKEQELQYKPLLMSCLRKRGVPNV
ncbi:MAG: hypothetical protein LBL82_06185 [Oscillospiraceae bacterium]|jgi:hypothetical protein|nr:hypothetical protein [Oscillospiraceae bacterium]